MSESASVRVLCRFRPINARERREFIEQGKDPEQMICRFLDDYNVEIMLESGLGSKKYTFDRVYPPGTPQRDVYNLAANDCVRQVLAGYNSSMMSYGQTGSGKTYTMQNFANYVSSGDEEAKGIIPRAGDHIFEYIASCDKSVQFNIKCSFLEIYNESVNDLLQVGPQSENLRIRESPERGIYVEGAVETQVTSARDLLSVIAIGDQNRAVSATNMNAVSSRSHTIIIITVGQKNQNDESKKEGRLCLVDLAGSEKTSKTAVEGQRLVEANNINQSLTSLGQCIKMLADGGGKGHIPYRQSKLTRLLQESLGGNSKTTLLIACSPHPFNRDETISTCEFGKRAKAIKNKVKVNAVKSVKELMAIIDRLTAQLQAQKQYISLLEAGLAEYREKAPGVQITTQISAGDALQQLLSGGQVSTVGGEVKEDGVSDPTTGLPASTGLPETIPHVDINADPQMTITSLQIELEREKKIRLNDKNGYEDDIASLKQQIQQLQDVISGQNNLLDGKGSFSNIYAESGDQDKAYTLVQKAQDKLLYYKQLCLDHGLIDGSDDENTSTVSNSQFQGQEQQFMDENAVNDREEQLKRRREGRDNASGKRVQSMQSRINDLEREHEKQRLESQQNLQQEQEKNKQLAEYVEKLEKECNRLRGLGAVEQDTLNLENVADPQEKIIKQLEHELKLSKQALLQEIGKSKNQIALQQQYESLQKVYRDQQCELIKLKQQMQEQSQQRSADRIKQLEIEVNLKNQQLHDRQSRLENANQRIELLKMKLLQVKPHIQLIQDEHASMLKQKQVDISKLQAQFNIEKQKFIGNLSQGSNIEKNIQGGVSTLLNNNPDLLSQIRKYKQNIGMNIE